MAGRKRSRAASKNTRRVRRRTGPARSLRDNNMLVKRCVHMSDNAIRTTWSSWNYAFRLSDLPDYSQFTNLFDRYRINAVKLLFIPAYNSIEENQGNLNQASSLNYLSVQPRVYTIIDKNGDATTSTENTMLENGNVRIIREPCKSFTVYCKNPCVQLAGEASGVIVSGISKARQWCDTTNYNMAHYGISWGGIAYNGTSSTVAQAYNIVATYYLQFKNVI